MKQQTDPRIVAGTIVACVGLVCLTFGGIFMSADKWHDIAHILTTPPAQGSVVGLLLIAAGMWFRARNQPPPPPSGPRRVPPGTLLVLCLALACAHGCTAAQQQAAARTVADVAAAAKPIAKWSCALARVFCAAKGDDVACGIVATVCTGVETALDVLPAVLPAPTSGDEQPHDLSVEE